MYSVAELVERQLTDVQNTVHVVVPRIKIKQTCAQSPEVLSSSWHCLAEEFNNNSSNCLSIYLDVQEDQRSDLRLNLIQEGKNRGH